MAFTVDKSDHPKWEWESYCNYCGDGHFFNKFDADDRWKRKHVCKEVQRELQWNEAGDYYH